MCVIDNVILFFFVKQKTAYDMRISDWSSDVCPSDLAEAVAGKSNQLLPAQVQRLLHRLVILVHIAAEIGRVVGIDRGEQAGLQHAAQRRSEERLVGKECVSTCRSRWRPAH